MKENDMGINAHTDPHMQHRFRTDTKDHTLVVLHDDGGYRHLSARKPGTGLYGFDIVTFPGTLIIRGDMGTYVFTRENDMLGFFDDGREPQQPITINPGYWAEKTPTHGINDTTIATRSRDRLIKQLIAAAAEHVDGWEDETHAIRDFYRAFADGPLDEIDDEHGLEEIISTITRFEHEHSRPFENAWEWDYSEYTAQFEWCCYAIVWACRMYRDIERQLTETDESAPTGDEPTSCPTEIKKTPAQAAIFDAAERSGLLAPRSQYDVIRNTQTER